MNKHSARNGRIELIETRRSQRVAARIPVQVRRQADTEGLMSEVGHTLIVNAHGALIALAMKVKPTEFLVIKHLKSGEERHSRVVRVCEETDSQHEIAFEFTEPAPRFWHIDFPPSNWTALEA